MAAALLTTLYGALMANRMSNQPTILPISVLMST